MDGMLNMKNKKGNSFNYKIKKRKKFNYLY